MSILRISNCRKGYLKCVQLRRTKINASALRNTSSSVAEFLVTAPNQEFRSVRSDQLETDRIFDKESLEKIKLSDLQSLSHEPLQTAVNSFLIITNKIILQFCTLFQRPKPNIT